MTRALAIDPGLNLDVLAARHRRAVLQTLSGCLVFVAEAGKRSPKPARRRKRHGQTSHGTGRSGSAHPPGTQGPHPDGVGRVRPSRAALDREGSGTRPAVGVWR